MLLSSSPKRKNDYPYLGSRILDGTTSDYDWQGIVGTERLPFVINPKRGYLVTANNRVVPENSKYDIGASMVATARSRRITEIIKNKIKSKEKFDVQDMIDIQQDMVDIIARDLIIYIVQICNEKMRELPKEEVHDA